MFGCLDVFFPMKIEQRERNVFELYSHKENAKHQLGKQNADDTTLPLSLSLSLSLHRHLSRLPDDTTIPYYSWTAVKK